MGAYILALMFLAGGAVFTSLGYSALVSTRKKRATWVAVEGTVVDFAERRGGEVGKGRSQTLYAPVYKYTFDGQLYSATSRVASSVPSHQVGDAVTLLVNPVKPADSEVSGGGAALTYGIMAAGLLCLAVAALVAWLTYTGQMTFE